MTIEIDRQVQSEEILQPGQRVDVLATFPETSWLPHEGQMLWEVLRGAKIRALTPGPPSATGKEGGAGSTPTSLRVTLEVTTEEAQRLALAETTGKLRLVLCSAQDGPTGKSPDADPLTTRKLIDLASGPLSGGPAAVAEPSGPTALNAGPGPGSPASGRTRRPSSSSSQRQSQAASRKRHQWPVKVIRGTKIETTTVKRKGHRR